jgi:hypothetical protein
LHAKMPGSLLLLKPYSHPKCPKVKSRPINWPWTQRKLAFLPSASKHMNMTHKQSAQLPAIRHPGMQKSVLRLGNASPPPDKQTFSWSWHRPAAIVVAHPLSRHNKWPLNNAFRRFGCFNESERRNSGAKMHRVFLGIPNLLFHK